MPVHRWPLESRNCRFALKAIAASDTAIFWQDAEPRKTTSAGKINRAPSDTLHADRTKQQWKCSRGTGQLK
jgi:hypothetical protein